MLTVLVPKTAPPNDETNNNTCSLTTSFGVTRAICCDNHSAHQPTNPNGPTNLAEVPLSWQPIGTPPSDAISLPTTPRFARLNEQRSHLFRHYSGAMRSRRGNRKSTIRIRIATKTKTAQSTDSRAQGPGCKSRSKGRDTLVYCLSATIDCTSSSLTDTSEI